MISSIQGYLSSIVNRPSGANSVAQTAAASGATNEKTQASKPASGPNTDTVQISAEGMAKFKAAQEAAAAQSASQASAAQTGAAAVSGVSGVSAVSSLSQTGNATPVQATTNAEELAAMANSKPVDAAAQAGGAKQAEAANAEQVEAVQAEQQTSAAQETKAQGPVPSDDRAPGAEERAAGTTAPSPAGVSPERANGIKKPGETNEAAADIATVKAAAEEAKPQAQEKVSDLSQVSATELQDMVNKGEATPADANAEMNVRSNAQKDTSAEVAANENAAQAKESNIVTDELTAVKAGTAAAKDVEE